MNNRRLKELLNNKFVDKNRRGKPINNKKEIKYIPSLNIKDDKNVN